MSDASSRQTVFLIKPKSGGFINDLQILHEDKRLVFHVNTRLAGAAGRVYTILDRHGSEYMCTRQDHTAVLPRHTVLHGGREIARVGQEKVVPLRFYVDFAHRARLSIEFGVFASVFNLVVADGGKLVAEVAQHRDTWIVALADDDEPSHILPMLAVICRETHPDG